MLPDHRLLMDNLRNQIIRILVSVLQILILQPFEKLIELILAVLVQFVLVGVVLEIEDVGALGYLVRQVLLLVFLVLFEVFHDLLPV